MVLVMVIICTLLGMAAPSLRRFFVSRSTNDTAARMLNLTKLARTSAVTEGIPYRFNIAATQHAFFLTVVRHGVEERLSSSLGRSFPIPEGTTVSLDVPGAEPGRDYVEFSTDGLVEPATITLKDIKGGIVEVACAAPTETFAIAASEETP
jgi:type II secretory pathway pseudopilin PulG